MSRCFPYPPPGYLVINRGTGDVALIESTIKLEHGKSQIKIDCKEQKRREKEEKKNQKRREKEEMKKEELKSSQNLDGASKRVRDSERHDNAVDKSWVDCQEVSKKRKSELDADQLERSSLTEELEQPILSESLCYSSDGTQSNTKKNRIEQPPSNGVCTTLGKVIRFKLKGREPESFPNNDGPSTSGRPITHELKMAEPLPVKEESRGTLPPPDIARKDFIHRQKPIIHPTDASNGGSITLQVGSSSVERSQKPKSAYKALFGDWIPLPIQLETSDSDDDQQWLLGTKKQVSHDVGRLSAYEGLAGRHDNLLFPRAHIVPEFNLYALPYTVLF